MLCMHVGGKLLCYITFTSDNIVIFRLPGLTVSTFGLGFDFHPSRVGGLISTAPLCAWSLHVHPAFKGFPWVLLFPTPVQKYEL